MINNSELPQRDLQYCLKQFEEFYNLLMKNAPNGYTPWFFPCDKGGKNPSIQAMINLDPSNKPSWHNESARLDKTQALEHINQGYNIGISARSGDPLILIDIDEDKYLEQLPKNTLTATSRKRAGAHAFCWDKDGSAKINLPTDYGEVRSDNQYVLACGSFVNFKTDNEREKKAYDKLPEYAKINKLLGYYTIRDYNSPTFINFDGLPQFFKDKENENINIESKIKQSEEIKSYENKEGKYTELFKLKISDIVEGYSSNTRRGHPLHDSDTDANFSLSKDGALAHCWRDLVSLNAVQFLCVKAGYMECGDCGTPHKGRGLSKIKGDKKALKIAYDEAVKMEIISEWKEKKNPYAVFGVSGQVENFYENKPFFYNKSGMFFIWDNDERKYDMCDDVDMLNGIADLGIDTITSKTKQEIINALKQFGRRNVPKEAPITWVQFKDKIIDSKTGEEFESSPDYFMTNTLPYSPSDSEETPVLDDLLEQWVGKDYVQTLYEIMAYSCSSDQFMQRMFALVGGGSNGKGTFMKVLSKFIGKPNVCSSELKELCSNGFETSIIYRQLLCILGEVSHGDMKNSNQIKKLAGEDDIRYCFKGKTAFSDVSITTLISLTNALPKTPDKTMGFYRKWLIIDFPNQFEGVNCNILDKIPEEEFNNLARKCLNILKDLYKTKRFHKEGTFQERMDRYEERSNPLGKFIEDYCIEELGGQYTLNEFTKEFNDFAKKNHIQVQTVRQIGKILRDEGLEIGTRNIDLPDGSKASKKVILNLIKTTETTETTEESTRFPSSKSLDSYGSSGSSGSFPTKKDKKIDDFSELEAKYKSEGLL